MPRIFRPWKSAGVISALPFEVKTLVLVWNIHATFFTPFSASFCSRKAAASDVGHFFHASMDDIVYGPTVTFISGSVLPHWKLSENAHSMSPLATARILSLALTRLSAPNT